MCKETENGEECVYETENGKEGKDVYEIENTEEGEGVKKRKWRRFI
jgi:hypothetical protein